MKKHYKVEVGGEVVYLRKTFLGWGVIFPWKLNNKIIWKNLIAGGSWIKLILIIIFVIIVIGAMFEVRELVTIANECLNKEVITWIN